MDFVSGNPSMGRGSSNYWSQNTVTYCRNTQSRQNLACFLWSEFHRTVPRATVFVPNVELSQCNSRCNATLKTLCTVYNNPSVGGGHRFLWFFVDNSAISLEIEIVPRLAGCLHRRLLTPEEAFRRREGRVVEDTGAQSQMTQRDFDIFSFNDSMADGAKFAFRLVILRL